MGDRRVLRASTRGSELARLQTDLVGQLLGPDIDLRAVVVSTIGDRRIDVAIGAMGGQGVFVREVQAAVLDGRADIAVHSAKDLPSTPTEGLVIAAFPTRADPRDALVGARLGALKPGARVGTGSARRAAQILAARRDLTIVGLRGNMAARLAAVSGDAPMDAVVVAVAALDRLGRRADAAEVFEADVMVPQVGQGALAVECRADDLATLAVLDRIDHGDTRRAVEAERAWLRAVGGGCDLPVGAYATVLPITRSIRLTGFLAGVDGRIVMRRTDEGTDPEELGLRVATDLLHAGGRALIDAAIDSINDATP